jgi:hypothetical protein
MKTQLLIKNLRELASSMREIGVDISHLFPHTDCDKQLNKAASVVEKWIEQVEATTL